MRVTNILFVFAACFIPIAAWGQEELPICEFFNGNEVTYACRCTPDSPVGDVFGTTMYAPATSLCSGARHAGTIQAEGGIVQIIRGIAKEAFIGSDRNGITSHNAGSAEYSIFFMGG